MIGKSIESKRNKWWRQGKKSHVTITSGQEASIPDKLLGRRVFIVSTIASLSHNWRVCRQWTLLCVDCNGVEINGSSKISKEIKTKETKKSIINIHPEMFSLNRSKLVDYTSMTRRLRKKTEPIVSGKLLLRGCNEFYKRLQVADNALKTSRQIVCNAFFK